MQIICGALTIYWLICIARVIFSFVPVEGGGFLAAAQDIVYKLTEPVFAAVRSVLPQPGGLPIDLSAIVVFIGISILRGVFC